MRKLVLILLAAGAMGTSAAAAPRDYPTEALADYVFGCMAANGQTQQALTQCSCSIDVIASIIPYEKYVEAETILSVGQVPGERTGMFREVPQFQEIVKQVRQAQAEAEVRCF